MTPSESVKDACGDMSEIMISREKL